ncbi:MAG: hypothetical protein WCH04_01680 [Gammaproteobacteria bacterium]
MQSPQGGFTTAVVSTFIRNALVIAVPLQNTRRGASEKEERLHTRLPLPMMKPLQQEDSRALITTGKQPCARGEN